MTTTKITGSPVRITDLALLHGVHYQTVLKEIKRGKLYGFKLGKFWFTTLEYYKEFQNQPVAIVPKMNLKHKVRFTQNGKTINNIFKLSEKQLTAN